MVNEKNIPSEWLIDDDFTNQRVDYFLKKKNPSLSFPNICKMLRKGVVKVNSKRVKNSYILKEKENHPLNFQLNATNTGGYKQALVLLAFSP